MYLGPTAHSTQQCVDRVLARSAFAGAPLMDCPTARRPGGSGEDTAGDNHTAGEPYPAAAIPAEPAWTLRAYRTTPEEWDEWVAVRRLPAARAARLWDEQHPEPWMKGRLDTQGKAWRQHVFTGTHERIEDHRVRLHSLYVCHAPDQFSCWSAMHGSPTLSPLSHNLRESYPDIVSIHQHKYSSGITLSKCTNLVDIKIAFESAKP